MSNMFLRFCSKRQSGQNDNYILGVRDEVRTPGCNGELDMGQNGGISRLEFWRCVEMR